MRQFGAETLSLSSSGPLNQASTITPIQVIVNDVPALRTAPRRSGEFTTVMNNAIDSHNDAASGGLLFGANWASSRIDDLQYCEQARYGMLLVVDLCLAVVQPGALHRVGPHISLRLACVDLAGDELPRRALRPLGENAAIVAQLRVAPAGAPQRRQRLGHRADAGAERLLAPGQLREPRVRALRFVADLQRFECGDSMGV